MSTTREVPRFLVVGLIATLVHISVYTVMIKAGLQPIAANTLGFITAVVFSFLGHYHVSFEVSGRYHEYAGRFFAASFTGLAASTAIMQLSIDHGLDQFSALLIVVLSVPALNYFLMKFWAFSDSAHLSGTSLGTLLTTLSIAGLTLWILSGSQLNHDSSWYLVATARWLDGSELYRDILEINPPLSFYLTVPAVIFGKYLNVDEALMFRLLVVFGSILSVIASTAILKRACSLSCQRSLLFTVFAGAGLLLSPVPDFGQREHLMLIFSLPLLMIIIIAQNHEDWIRRLIVPITLVGMLGIALKPHFLLPITLVFAVNIFHDWSWKTLFNKIHLTILAVLLSYSAFILVVHPDYIDFMVPLGITVYGYSEVDLWALIAQVTPIIAPVLLMFACTCPGKPERRILVRAMAVLLGFALIYLVQFKGWSYQLVPARGFALIFTGLALSLGTTARRGLGRLAALMLVATLWNSLAVQLQSGPYRNYNTSFLKRALEDVEDVNSMMFFSTNVSSGFPLVRELGLEWASRLPTLWLIPGIVDKDDPAICVTRKESSCTSRIPASTFLRKAITEDLIKFDADLVIVDGRTRKPYVQTRFDYLEFMRKDEHFQKLWQEFKLVKKAASYDIWRRIDD